MENIINNNTIATKTKNKKKFKIKLIKIEKIVIIKDFLTLYLSGVARNVIIEK